MRLAEVIRDNAADIIKDWQEFARSCPPASGLTGHEARDDIAGMLKFVIGDLETPSPLDEPKAEDTSCDAAKRHAEQRFTKGFDTLEMAAEFRALRVNVMRRWLAQQSQVPPEVEDIIRFNEIIDHMSAESLERYVERERRARSLFLGTLIHDIRNPLNAIVQSADLLEMLGSVDEKKKKIFTQIHSSAARISRLVSQIIDAIRLQLGKPIPVSRAPLDIVDTVKRIIDEIQAVYPDRKIRLNAPEKLTGDWDSGRISQLASNLVGNALQHGAEELPVTVSLSADDGDAVFAVHNFGDPISPEDLSVIFDPLERGLGKIHEDNDSMSMGLGLFIAEQIARAHDGRIAVASGADTGTTFTVRLPLHRPQEKPYDQLIH
jgi:signal transduction histidine kinase